MGFSGVGIGGMASLKLLFSVAVTRGIPREIESEY